MEHSPRQYHNYKRDPFCVAPYYNAKRRDLKFQVRSNISGKWERAFFRSEREAKSYRDLKRIELLNHGREGVTFPSALRVAAQWGANQLEPFGKTIRDAVEFYLRHLRTERGSIPVAQAVDELVANRRDAGLSKLYYDDLRWRLNRFANAFADRSVASIATQEIEAWLESLGVGAVTRNTFRRDVRTLYSFCVKRNYCAENPAAATQRAKEQRRDVEVLSVEVARRLLAGSSPELLPYFSIGLFAGLRPSEIWYLQWSDVDFDDALITVRSTKTGRKRFVTMQPNLIEWLKPHRRDSGRVVDPVSFRRQNAAAKAVAGLKTWPVNVLRHSFGSYHLAQFANLNALALEMGNSPEVIEKHYRQAVRPREAHRYWAITPGSVTQDRRSKVVARIA